MGPGEGFSTLVLHGYYLAEALLGYKATLNGQNPAQLPHKVAVLTLGKDRLRRETSQVLFHSWDLVIASTAHP